MANYWRQLGRINLRRSPSGSYGRRVIPHAALAADVDAIRQELALTICEVSKSPGLLGNWRGLFSIGHVGRLEPAGRQLRAAAVCASGERTYCAKYMPAAEGGFFKRYGRVAGAVVLLAATGGVAASAFDDVLIYKRCSSKAMEKATADPRIIDALGESIKSGAWYEASLGVARNRHSASCSFPISGTLGSGRLHLKAVRVEGGRSTLVYNVLGSGRWDVLMLEALVPQAGSVGDNRVLRRINLMQADDSPKSGDKLVQGEGQGDGHNTCQKAAVQEV